MDSEELLFLYFSIDQHFKIAVAAVLHDDINALFLVDDFEDFDQVIVCVFFLVLSLQSGELLQNQNLPVEQLPFYFLFV